MALKKIRLGDTSYDISNGTSVSVENEENLIINNEGGKFGPQLVANPTDVATEILSKLKIADTTYSMNNGASGEGPDFEVIDITNIDNLTDISNLSKCYLKDGNYIYHLSYVDGNEYYFENVDETIYRYISIYGDGSISRETSKELTTKEYVNDLVKNKITVVINDDDTIDLTIN